MPKIPEYYNFGDNEDTNIEELMVKLQRMYTDLARAINQKPDLYQRSDTSGPGSGDGQATDTNLPQGSININLTTDKVEMLTNHTSPTNVTWVTLG